MTRHAWLQEKRSQVSSLGEVATNDIVPSRRDFAQFIASQRTELGVVARLKRADPLTGGQWPDRDLQALAGELDETDVGALAICPAAHHGGAITDLDAITRAVTAPVLCDDLFVAEAQLYLGRRAGADAVRIPVSELDAATIERLADIAVSLHMTPLLEVGDEGDLEVAPIQAPNVIGVDCAGEDGFVDVERTVRLADRVARHVVVVALAEIRSVAEARRLSGHVDAVVVGDLLLDSDEPQAVIAELLG